VLGLVLWSATSYISGRAEPWDSSFYWSGSYPLSLLLTGCLGFAFPERTWRWAVAMTFTQLPILLFAGSDFGLLPLGLILLAFLALPAVLTGWIGGRLRRWSKA
jgi:hypothetical protein